MNFMISSQMDSAISSHRVNVFNDSMHYLCCGSSDEVVLFLHGMPTSSYLWRHILPQVGKYFKAIAPDLIGMGQSSKPSIDYTIDDHIAYVSEFIDKLDLKKLHIVMHGWGSIIGFDYARRFPEKIQTMTFFESHIRPIDHRSMLSLPMQEFMSILEHSDSIERLVMDDNLILKGLLMAESIDQLPDAVKQNYLAPFQAKDDFRPLIQYVKELPTGVLSHHSLSIVESYAPWLQTTSIPKLMLYAMPGFMTTIDTVSWAKSSLACMELIELPEALHLPQESNPALFVEALVPWLKSQSSELANAS